MPLDLATAPVAEVRAARDGIAGLVGEKLSDAERIDLLRALEELKSAAAAAQAHLTVGLDVSQRAAQEAAGEPAARRGRGVAAQVALARRTSPNRGARHLGLAKVLVREMPHTLAALAGGHLSEWQATLLARESAILGAEHRAQVDRTLCADPARLEGLGDRALANAARALANRLDPAAAVRRAARAAEERRVSIRPMPDTMTLVSALLPMHHGVSVYAALTREADRARAQGDPRTRGQVMADTLVVRTTGQATADEVGVGVVLVTPIDSLLPAGPGSRVHEPAHVQGYGTVPGGYAQELLRRALATTGTRTASWVRRLLTAPETGQVVALDSRGRTFPEGLSLLVTTRDAGICRTPWCDAPIRHTDHVVGVAEGGETTEHNGQGLCEACNHHKQAPGWRARTVHGPRHTVVTTTPTGHTYRSTAPPLPGAPPRVEWSSLEHHLRQLLNTA